MTFAELPDGALFRWVLHDLPLPSRRWNGTTIYRKVGERCCDAADLRGALMVGAPRARVQRVKGSHGRLSRDAL